MQAGQAVGRWSVWAALLALLALASCRSGPTGVSTLPEPTTPLSTPAVHTATSAPTATVTPLPPTPTSAPAAAHVDGVDVPMITYQSELARYSAAQGRALTLEEERRVLEDLIAQTLLAKAAVEAGFSLDEAALQARLENLANELGGQPALAEWMAKYGYTEASFRQELERSIAAAWMRDQIASEIPEAVEQVRAQQILVPTREEAQQALDGLQAGLDFARLAAAADPVSEGEMGWFPRGYLLDPALEEAAFQLEPGQYSSIVESPAGFHILQVLERDPQHPLTPDARLTLQQQAVRSWLEQQRSTRSIEVLAP